ncbi:MAG: DNA ligase D [Thermoleophilia bacterium]
MSLEEYRRKRTKGATPEPIPGEAPAAGPESKAAGGRKPAAEPGAQPRFVIHKHDARRLHYDLRLEHEGVLLSWAIPKGLATPHDTRKLAVHVEDHPLEYIDFAGGIPAGEYGAGMVEIWDSGVYEPLEDITRSMEEGKLTIHLQGTKVDGEFSLVRMKEENWLVLLHKKGRLNPDLRIEGEAAKMPAGVTPMKAVLGREPFSSKDFIYEIKFDGIRAVTFLGADGSHKIMSRNRKELGQRFPELADIGSSFLAEEAVVDGEIVAMDEAGVSRFQLLQGRINLTGVQAIDRVAKETPAYYYIFDLLFLNGRDLTGLPLERRKQILARIMIPSRHIRLSEWIETSGEAFFNAARERGLEGIMAKKRTSPYLHKRSRNWIKLKTVNQQEFVIAGFTGPRGRRSGFGALLLGYYRGGELVYAGHVGTGFTEQSLADLYARMEPLIQQQPPFAEKPVTNMPARWLRPELVAEIKFAEWTREGSLRQPVFLGLRTDVNPGDVIKETSTEAAPAEKTAVEKGAAAEAPPAGEATAEAPPAEAPGGRPFVYPGMPPPRGAKQEVSIGGRRLILSHLDKIFWPEQGYRKYDLINYYHRVSSFIIPHLRGRPLTLKRYPDGFGSQPFFQKEAPAETPSWVRTETILSPDSERGKIRYIICDDLPALYFIVNIACISQNPWLSALPHPDNPDFIVLDIDPPGPEAFDQCIEIALLVRKHLAEFGLKGYPKTSGATGIHIYVPVRPVYSYEQARQFAQIVAWLCREERPDLITLEPSTARRQGKVYLDFLQNVKGKTVASVYSVRAQPGAPVSTPLDWDELVPGKLRPGNFDIMNLPGRLEEKGDLFAPVLTEKQDLMLALQRGEKLLTGT